MKRGLLSLSLLSLLAVASSSLHANFNQVSAPNFNSITTLSARMREALIQQISLEQASSNLYLTFASYFGDLGLDGCEAFFRNSSAEETQHALLFYNLLMEPWRKISIKGCECK